MTSKKDPIKKSATALRIEDILDKDPKIYAEHLFENYDQESINTIMKGLQKKIIEKENSLKQMLSLKYVDLLNCSELIQNLKTFSKEIAHNADFTQEYLQKSEGVLTHCRLTKSSQTLGLKKQKSSRQSASEFSAKSKPLTAADEHLFYIAGQKILLSNNKGQNSLETVFVITTYLTMFNQFEMQCKVKKTRKMTELLFLLEDSLFAHFDRSFNFSTGVSNYNNILPVLVLLKLGKFVRQSKKQKDFESTQIFQYLRDKLDCDMSELLFQSTIHSYELTAALKVFFYIIEAMIKQRGGDALTMLQFFTHQLAESTRIFLVEKDPYDNVSSYLESFKDRVADLFPFERLTQIERLLSDAVDLESDLYFDDPSTAAELIKEFYSEAVKFIRPLLVCVVTDENEAHFDYKNIRSLLFEDPSQKDFHLLEKHLWTENLEQLSIGKIAKEIWTKRVDQVYTETILSVKIEERIGDLMSGAFPELENAENNFVSVGKHVDMAVKEFVETLEKIFIRFCDVVNTGSNTENEANFFQVSNLIEGFQARFEGSLNPVLAALHTSSMSSSNSNKDKESETILLYLILAFLDKSFIQAKSVIQQKGIFEAQRTKILEILKVGQNKVLTDLSSRIMSQLQTFLDYVKESNSRNEQNESWSNTLLLELVYESDGRLQKEIDFVKKINEITMTLDVFDTLRNQKYPLSAYFRDSFKKLTESTFNGDNSIDQISSILKSFDLAAKSEETRKLQFLQFYSDAPSFSVLSHTHPAPEKTYTPLSFNAHFVISEPFLNTTLFPKGSNQPHPATIKPKPAAAPSNAARNSNFSIGQEGRQLIAQQTEETIEKARNMVGGMLSNWMNRLGK